MGKLYSKQDFTKEELEKLEKLTKVRIGSLCPHCTFGTIKLVYGKYGKFLGCDQFPSCAFSQKINN